MPPEQHLAGPSDLTAALVGWQGGHRGRAAVADAVGAIAATGARLASVIGAADLDAEARFVAALAGQAVAAVCSARTADPIPLTPDGRLLVTLDPINGSANLDVNAPVGTVFSVLPAGGHGGDIDAAARQPGRHQLAAGIILYGPRTVLALTLGAGTDIYVLDPATGRFTLSRPGVRIPVDAQEYAVDAANARHWVPGVRSYVSDLVSGSGGPRGRDFTMYWSGALVGDAVRILIRGGVFLCPADERHDHREGRIALVYEANPVAFLCEQAGGLATNGVDRVLDLTADSVHRRTPLIFGSRGKVERVRRYLLDPATTYEQSPLFSPRGLYRV
jgi:fructose-1,6-bisphosphatase I